MSTVVYNLNIDGDSDELMSKLRMWVEEDLIKGRLSGQFFSIKEIDKAVVKGINQSDDGKLISIIEGVVENGKLILTAKATTPYTTIRNLKIALIFGFLVIIALEGANFLYGSLTLLAAILMVVISNSLERRRIKNDLDVFVWMVNMRCNVKLVHQ
jgi:hypothetical protein